MRCPRELLATAVAFAALALPQPAQQPARPPARPPAPQPGPQPVPVGVGLGGGDQGAMAGRGGGRNRVPVDQAQALDLGFAWLRSHQREDGSWAPGDGVDVAAAASATVATTSVCLLAMLGDGSTMRAGPHKEPIKQAIKWLRRCQQDDGLFVPRADPGFAAAQAVATLAMTETCVLSDYKTLRKNAELGLRALAGMRAADGGWRATAADEHCDPAMTLWCAMTYLAAGRSDFDLPAEDPEAIAAWLAGPAALRVPDRGPFGLPAPRGREAVLRDEQAAANALCGHLVGAADADHVTRALDRARDAPRQWTADRAGSMFEWFCSAHALWQRGDTAAVGAIGDALVAAQVGADPEADPDAGSWPPHGAWGVQGGRAWTTAMALLALEASYRYVRLVR